MVCPECENDVNENLIAEDGTLCICTACSDRLSESWDSGPYEWDEEEDVDNVLK